MHTVSLTVHSLLSRAGTLSADRWLRWRMISKKKWVVLLPLPSPSAGSLLHVFLERGHMLMVRCFVATMKERVCVTCSRRVWRDVVVGDARVLSL